MRIMIAAITMGLLPVLAFASDDPIPLGKLVSAYLTTPDASPEWSMGATELTPQIAWQTVGVETQGCGSYSSCRRGTARVSVAGRELQNLRQRLEPVRWDLLMTSSDLPKFGPEQVVISPSCDTVSCEFDFESGMAHSGIALQRLCHAGPSFFRQTAYFLTQRGRHAIAVVVQSSGSGGESTDLTLVLATDPGAQDWCAEARAMQ